MNNFELFVKVCLEARLQVTMKTLLEKRFLT